MIHVLDDDNNITYKRAHSDRKKNREAEIKELHILWKWNLCLGT